MRKRSEIVSELNAILRAQASLMQAQSMVVRQMCELWRNGCYEGRRMFDWWTHARHFFENDEGYNKRMHIIDEHEEVGGMRSIMREGEEELTRELYALEMCSNYSMSDLELKRFKLSTRQRNIRECYNLNKLSFTQHKTNAPKRTMELSIEELTERFEAAVRQSANTNRIIENLDRSLSDIMALKSRITGMFSVPGNYIGPFAARAFDEPGNTMVPYSAREQLRKLDGDFAEINRLKRGYEEQKMYDTRDVKRWLRLLQAKQCYN